MQIQYTFHSIIGRRQLNFLLILISYINISFFTIYISLTLLFLLANNKTHKKQKFSALDIVEYRSKETWSISSVTLVDIITQVSLTPLL